MKTKLAIGFSLLKKTTWIVLAFLYPLASFGDSFEIKKIFVYVSPNQPRHAIKTQGNVEGYPVWKLSFPESVSPNRVHVQWRRIASGDCSPFTEITVSPGNVKPGMLNSVLSTWQIWVTGLGAALNISKNTTYLIAELNCPGVSAPIAGAYIKFDRTIDAWNPFPDSKLSGPVRFENEAETLMQTKKGFLGQHGPPPEIKKKAKKKKTKKESSGKRAPVVALRAPFKLSIAVSEPRTVGKGIKVVLRIKHLRPNTRAPNLTPTCKAIKGKASCQVSKVRVKQKQTSAEMLLRIVAAKAGNYELRVKHAAQVWTKTFEVVEPPTDQRRATPPAARSSKKKSRDR